jgi:hypothetical protein
LVNERRRKKKILKRERGKKAIGSIIQPFKSFISIIYYFFSGLPKSQSFEGKRLEMFDATTYNNLFNIWRHDNHFNDTQHNDTHHNGTEHNDTQQFYA